MKLVTLSIHIIRSRISLSLLFGLFMFVSNAQERIDFSNQSLSRSFEISDGVFSTLDLTNLNTEKDFISGRSIEFSFRANDSEVTSESFMYVNHTGGKDGDTQNLEVELEGRKSSSAEGLVVKLRYWLYADLPVIRKQIDIENNSSREIALTDLDIENLNLDVSGYHISELYTAYGQNFEKKPYKGNYNDATILIFDPKGNQGVIVGNEALSVMKRTEIYTQSFPIVQVGLAGSDKDFPFKVYLDPGESFTSPRTFLCLVETSVWQMAFEGPFADFIRDYADIKLHEHDLPPLLFYNTWRPFRMDINEDLVKSSADALEGSGTDIFIIDCGWYDMMGSYIPDKNKFPNGMVPVCEYIQKKGMKPGMWFSFATANVESKVVKEHPEWILKDKNGDPTLIHVITDNTLGEKSYTMSMASPWYDYILDILSDYIRTCNLSYVKLDLAAALGSYQPDPDASGDYEGGGVKEYKDRASSYWAIFQRTLDFCDDLHKEFPDLLIDYTYETHGRHNAVDYALLQYAEYTWLTNYELEPPDGPISIRQIRYRRARTMPVSTLLIGNQNMINPSMEMNEYTYMSVASSTGILVGDVRQMDEDTRQWYKEWNSWFTKMNEKYQFTKFYQIGDIFDFPTRENWDGCYRFNTVKEGGVLFYYRNGSLDKTRTFKVHCVNPDSKYRVYNPDNANEDEIYSGEQLLEEGLEIHLPEMFSAKVLGIEKI
jgi:alpha-galactosidase